MLAKRSTYTMVALLTAVLVLAACGKKNPPPAAVPPPIVNTNPGGFVGGGGACGSVGGVPLNGQSNTPFYANLSGQQQGLSSAALNLNVMFAQQPNYTNTQQNIVASGQLNFPDLARVLQSSAPIQNTTFCVSSSSIQGGLTPGVMIAGTNQIALTLRGTVRVPYYPPGYNSYTVQYYEELVEVEVGQQCQAVLYQGAIYGCVSVKVGNRQPIYYQAN